jgi:hypothetical protein
MFDEDLSLFFDTGDFAVAAVLKDAAGAELRTANVIIETPTREAELLGGDVMQGTPSATARTADLDGVRRGYTLTVGAAVYAVTEPPEDDGTGVSTLRLRKQ